MDQIEPSREAQQAEWVAKKIDNARKRVEDAFIKNGLNRMNPGAKEIRISPSFYKELREALTTYLKLVAHKEGKVFEPKADMVYNGPFGPIKIKAIEVENGV